MYAFDSHARGKLFHCLVGGCFVTALLLFGIAGVEGMAYPAVYQFTAFVLLTAGVYLLVRYGLKIYRYEIAENGIVSAAGDKQYDLVVTEITGRRIRVMTRVALRDIESAVILSRKKDATTLIGGRRVYRYTNRPFESVSCYLILPEENAVVVIPEDENMMRHLEMFCSVKKENEL